MSLNPKNRKIGIVGYNSEISKELRNLIEEKTDFDFLKSYEYSFYDYSAKEEFSIIGSLNNESIIVKYPQMESLIQNDILILTIPFEEIDELKNNYKGIIIDISDSLKEYDFLYREGETSDFHNIKTIKIPSASSWTIYRILKPIEEKFGLEYVNSTILFPVSIKEGGINELLNQTIDTLNIKSIKPEIFSDQVAFSFSAMDDKLEDSINKEIKILFDNINIKIVGFIAPIFHSISFFIFLKTKKPIEEDVLKFSFDIMDDFEFINKKVVQPQKAAESDKILLSEIKHFDKTDIFLNAAVDNFKTAVLKGTINLLKKIME